MFRSFCLLSALTALCIAAGLHPASSADQVLPRPSLPPSTRGPVKIVFTPKGDAALVAESDTGTVAVVEPTTGHVLRRFSTGGEQPSGLAVAGETVVVANTFSGSVAAFDLATGKRSAFVSLRGEPSEVVLSADGRRAFVSLAQLDQVVVLSVPELKVTSLVRVGHRPKAMALTPDGRTLLVANFQGGDVTFLDTETLKATRTVKLAGVNLRGISIAPDGRHAYVTGQVPGNLRPTADPLDIWANTLFRVDLGSYQVTEATLDRPQGASPDPDGVRALGDGRVVVALTGSDEAVLVRGSDIERRVAVGAHPRGVAVTADGKQIWIANELDSTISLLDAATLSPVRRIELGTPPKRQLRLYGRYLFGNAQLTEGHQFTCESCHPDGKMDGLTWEFVHVPDRVPRRNTRSLRGGITLTSPFRWSGYENDIEDFFQDEIAGLLKGPKQPHEPLHALWNLVDQYPLPPNPYRQANGQLTPSAKRGSILFKGKAACAGCHGGEFFGGTGKKAWVGTTLDGLKLDVPHLTGVYDTAPYLHDGRAPTLESIFKEHNAAHKHGAAHLLMPSEMKDLLEYVREL